MSSLVGLLLCLSFTASTAQQSLPRSHSKYRAARTVFDEIVRTIGNGRTKPALRILASGTRTSRQVAWFSPKDNAVTVEERAYDVLASMGADSLDAVAWLLGHELAHCYQDHGWVGDFGSSFADLGVGQVLQESQRDMAELLEKETEADYFGGFYAYMAGYNSLGVAPQAIERIYAEYELSEDMTGYPSRSERQLICKRSKRLLGEMVPVFEAGNRLILLRQYAEAAHFFDLIGKTFASREIINNAGVARALAAIELFEAGELRFAYPLELDAETRLRQDSVRPMGGTTELDRERRERLLEEALEAFENAARKDRKYATAYVNMACVLELQGEIDEAIHYAERAMRVAEANDEALSLANAHIVRGIAEARAELPYGEWVQEDFEGAKIGNQTLAARNLQLWESGPGAPDDRGAEAGETVYGGPERMFGPESEEFERLLQEPDVELEVPRLAEQSLVVWDRQEAGLDWMAIDTGSSVVSLLATTENHRGQTARGIGRNDRADRVQDAYGSPTRVQRGRQEIYHIYELTQIIFRIGADERVRGWMTYQISDL